MTITASVDFDGGGGAEITVDGTTVEVENVAEETHDEPGYMAFRLDGVAGETVTIEVTNLSDVRMPSNIQLMYSDEMEPGEWARFEDSVSGGFSHTFQSDTVYIANGHVYPYDAIVERINELDGHDYVETEVIGASYAEELDMHAIRISRPDVDPSSANDVVILTRSHPGEIAGSYHMDAIIDWVIERFDNDDFNEDYLFHFMPDTNPDGIYNGHQRHDMQGHDLNREWDHEGVPEIENLRNYMSNNVENYHWGIDLHSTTNDPFDYEAVWYDERAVGDEDMGIINELVDVSMSLDYSGGTTDDSRSRGFILDEFDGVMVSTEVSYWFDYSVNMYNYEGENFVDRIVDATVTETIGEAAVTAKIRRDGEWRQFSLL